jgi:hypothetical protein
MGTRGNIGIINQDGTVETVYSHFDNYIEDGTGEYLYNNPMSEEDVRDMMDEGDRSNIHEVSTSNTDPSRHWDSVDQLLGNTDYLNEYLYLFDSGDGSWLVWEATRGQTNRGQLIPLDYYFNQPEIECTGDCKACIYAGHGSGGYVHCSNPGFDEDQE